LLDREPGQLTIMYKQMRYSLILPVLLVSQQAFPQTKISLRTESSDVDFVNAASTRPFKTGTTLPGTCAQGDSFLKSDASPGQNIYVCTAPGTPGTWTVQGSNGSGGSPASISSLTDFGLTTTASAAAVNCPSGQCQVRIGEKNYVFTGSAMATTLTGGGAAATVFFYIDASGAMDFGYDGNAITGATLNGLNGVSAVTNYPANVIPIAHCAVSSNQFSTCTDDRALFGRAVIDQGAGIVVLQNPVTGHTALSVNTATVPLLGTTNTFSGALNDFSGSQLRVTTGSGAPPASTCTGATTVGYLYVRSDAGAPNSSVYGCDKIGASSWGWELLQYSSASLPGGVAVTGGPNTFTSGLQDFSATQFRTTTGAGIPSAALCAAASNIGLLYIRNDAAAPNASVYSCDLTAPSTYSWELIQGSGGGSGTVTGPASGSSGSLGITGPYLTDGTNYWVMATGQHATLFSNAGFSFQLGNASYAATNKVGYISLPAGSTASDYFQTATSATTLTATFNINDPSGTSTNNGAVGIAFTNGRFGVECGVVSVGASQPNGFRPYMNTIDAAYNYQGTVAALGSTFGSNPVTLKLAYAAQVSTCYVSTDGGVTFTTFASQNGANTGYLNSAPTTASVDVTAGGFGASVGIYSLVLQ
jgi:hypothetical protein